MKRLDSYSQYFLKSPQLIKELVGHTTIKKSDTVYDIGAGSGIISSVLSERAGKVFAVEVEPRMAEKLRDNMRGLNNVTVVEKDFIAMELPTSPYKIFSNIPFHLSSPIVRKITEATNPPEATYLIVQKQFGYKLVPSPDRFTAQLAILIAPLFEARIRRRLQKSDYTPSPNVDTVLLELLRRPTPLVPLELMPVYREFVTDCFSTPKRFAKAPQREVNLPVGIKPSEMSIDQWIVLFHATLG
jgi:16S rRNA A1518/A1519 N6-dimethyltransferase RsmA/KsgA/DIM1 with predicted DNA glycosylase/AP lyase activity